MKKIQTEALFALPEKKKKTWLSHSGIEGMGRCKRCFYLQYKHKIYHPEGIQSRLANRFDTVLKSYFDIYRKKGSIPPFVENTLQGKLQNPFKETYFHTFNNEYGFYGKLDECLVNEGKYIPVDFKTSSSDPREKDILNAYQNQIDAYAFLLQKNRLEPAGYGFLIFFYPDLTTEIKNGFPMINHIVRLEAHPDLVHDRIQKAVDLLEGPLPEPAEDCSFCNWFQTVKQYYV
ncbi:MAG: PD-(D/E)XK nuclease family protein [Microgenomates group bacterium]